MRQLLIEQSPDENGEITVSGDIFHYISHVLRLKDGDCIDAVLQDGGKRRMTIADVGRFSLILRETCACGGPSVGRFCPCEIWLLQILPKKPRFELIVRQATEIGVSRIIPVAGDFSVKGRVDEPRLKKIIAEARQQSGSQISTELHCACGIVDAISLAKRHAAENFASCDAGFFVLSENDAEPLFSAASRPLRFCCVAVGCEGGFSPREFSALLDAGFRAVHFATNILRVETAAVYGLAAVQTLADSLNGRHDFASERAEQNLEF